MGAHSHADAVPVRLAAERLHRFDIEATRERLAAAPNTFERRCREIGHASARRTLVRRHAAVAASRG